MPQSDDAPKPTAGGQEEPDIRLPLNDREPTNGSMPDAVGRLSSESFDSWWLERQFALNIREGQPYFNGPSPIPPPHRHSPSQLLQCKRKIQYRQGNAPEEIPDPEGIYWTGTRFEEDIVVPFLAEEIAQEDEYVANSLWVDYTVETPASELRIKGSTDPVIVSRENEPILLTEVKTKKSLDTFSGADRRHKAQATAYMVGLSRTYDREIRDAVIVYVDRSTLDLAPVHVPFSSDFWEETVLGWAAEHTTYRLNDDLPPADPEQGWECNYCSYQERCGKGEREFNDEDATGLLPLYEYPREKVVEYLQAFPDAKLTPTLAHAFPELTEDYDVYDWECRGCGGAFDWNAISSPTSGNAPRCPACESQGNIRLLSGPLPENQCPTTEGGSNDH